jgi:hypothetical protein
MSRFSFSSRQLSTLRAAADRIVPPDEAAGAAEAGAVEFISRLLNREMSAHQATYIQGLDDIDHHAVKKFNSNFANIHAPDQDAILEEIERTSPSFFRMLVEHVLESYYSDPSNGGNREAVSWKMIGYRAEGGTR